MRALIARVNTESTIFDRIIVIMGINSNYKLTKKNKYSISVLRIKMKEAIAK